MARRNHETSDTNDTNSDPFKADPNANTGAPAANDSGSDDDIDSISMIAGTPPVGIQPLHLAAAKQVMVDNKPKIILEFELDSAEFEGVELAGVWFDPHSRQDIRRMKLIVVALGGSWDEQTGRPNGGYKSIRGKRGRGVIGWYEAKDEFQVAKFPPMFRGPNKDGSDDTVVMREAFLAACKDEGFDVEFETVSKGKYVGQLRATCNPDIFNGCGILPLAE